MDSDMSGEVEFVKDGRGGGGSRRRREGWRQAVLSMQDY